MTLLVNIIGAGQLGQTIGHLLVKQQLITIKGICNRSKTSTMNAIKWIGQGEYYSSIDALPPVDITFITTPDDLIATACDALSCNKNIKPGNVVLHCSGSLTSDVLNPMKANGCYIASIHPMRSFAQPELSIQAYSGTYCAIEGDKEAIICLSTLFNAIGSITYEIDKKRKSSYHAAGVFASNYVVTLAQQALSCLQEAGVKNDMAMQVITNLMQGTVVNLEKTLSPRQSLTGPIKRGDVATLVRHIQSLTNTEQQQLYAALGHATLALTDHDEAKKESIAKALTYTNSANRS